MQCYSRSQVGKTVVVTSDHDQEDSILSYSGGQQVAGLGRCNGTN